MRDKITDIESLSKMGAWLKKTFALVAHHRSGVTAAGTYAGQDQIQDSARQRMHASRLQPQGILVNRATMRGEIEFGGCG